MLPQMPTKQVAAIILASKPAAAATVLVGMTPDRLSTLVSELPPRKLGRIIIAGGPDNAVTLIAALSPAQRIAVLSTMTTTEIGRLVIALPPELAWMLLDDVTPDTAASILAELRGEPRRRLEDSAPPDLWPKFAAAVYRRAAVETIVRTASRTAWLDEYAGDVIVEVLGKSIQIAVRYRSTFELEASDVANEARRARWDRIAGLLVFNNMRVGINAQHQADVIRQAGSPIDIIKWRDAGDDGVLKRSLVRLSG